MTDLFLLAWFLAFFWLLRSNTEVCLQLRNLYSWAVGEVAVSVAPSTFCECQSSSYSLPGSELGAEDRAVTKTHPGSTLKGLTVGGGGWQGQG